jgi:hypothetical protein
MTLIPQSKSSAPKLWHLLRSAWNHHAHVKLSPIENPSEVFFGRLVRFHAFPAHWISIAIEYKNSSSQSDIRAFQTMTLTFPSLGKIYSCHVQAFATNTQKIRCIFPRNLRLSNTETPLQPIGRGKRLTCFFKEYSRLFAPHLEETMSPEDFRRGGEIVAMSPKGFEVKIRGAKRSLDLPLGQVFQDTVITLSDGRKSLEAVTNVKLERVLVREEMAIPEEGIGVKKSLTAFLGLSFEKQFVADPQLKEIILHAKTG